MIDDIRTLDDYLADIKRYVQENTPYAHNLISLTLRQIDRECGSEHAQKAIKDFELRKKYGIRK